MAVSGRGTAGASSLGCAVLFYLTDRPEVANWLAPDEKQWLTAVMAEERRRVEAEPRVSVWRSMIDRRVLALGGHPFRPSRRQRQHGGVHCADDQQLGLTNMQTGWLTAVPFIFGTIGILVWGRYLRSDERAEMEPYCLLPVHGVGMGLAALSVTAATGRSPACPSP